jgi:2-amino-4-hydroxy-6-hydroxymethyldihydropteridine diphosphokinase
MPTRAYLLLGSNLGDRDQLLYIARVRIEILAGRIAAASPLYETSAWGKTDQPDFLNQVFAIDTSLEPKVLLSTLLAIERSMGRTRQEKWGPRPIDIDILLYGDRVVNEPDLVIPHPSLPERRFALTPLHDVAPALRHPVLGKTVRKLLEECKDLSDVKAIPNRPGS